MKGTNANRHTPLVFPLMVDEWLMNGCYDFMTQLMHMSESRRNGISRLQLGKRDFDMFRENHRSYVGMMRVCENIV